MIILSKLLARLHAVIKDDTKMSVDVMVLNWKLAYPLSNKKKHLKRVF
jgi:hypothetical protein